MAGLGDESRTRVLWGLRINESRLHSERTAAFLVANSFLLAGFALLREQDPEGIQFVPIIAALLFTWLHYLSINYGERVLEQWNDMLQETPERKAETAMFKATWIDRSIWGNIAKHVGRTWLPVLFFVTWLVLLSIEVVHTL